MKTVRVSGSIYRKEDKKRYLICYWLEVGLDSNGRKNRGGTTMESIIEVFLKRFMWEK